MGRRVLLIAPQERGRPARRPRQGVAQEPHRPHGPGEEQNAAERRHYDRRPHGRRRQREHAGRGGADRSGGPGPRPPRGRASGGRRRAAGAPPADPCSETYDDPSSSPGLTATGRRGMLRCGRATTDDHHLPRSRPCHWHFSAAKDLDQQRHLADAGHRRHRDRPVLRADRAGGLRPILPPVDSVGHHRGRHRHLRSAGHDLPQGQSDGDRPQQDHGRAGGHRRRAGRHLEGPRGPLSGRRQRAAGDPRPDRRHQGQTGRSRLQTGHGHRSGRPQRARSRADQRQSRR